MHCLNELICSECKDNFESASELLKHFAGHVVDAAQDQKTSKKQSPDKKNIPDLRPIAKNTTEEVVNPLTVCEVTMKEDAQKTTEISSKQKKYKCTHCNKSFGWSTDLKRHILIHTGERPFKCNLCSLSFTRNFLLQKHVAKIHKPKYAKSKVPDLKPIYAHKNKPKKSLGIAVKKHFMNRGIMRTPICSN